MRLGRVTHFLCLIVAFDLGGCGGGSSSGTLSPLVPQPSASPNANIAFVLTIPASSTSSAQRRPADTSAATASVTVALGTKVLATTNVSSGSNACTSVASGGLTCSIRVAAPVGSDMFTITTYDQPNGAGNILASANVVETVSTTPTTANITVDAAIAKIALTLSNPYPPVATATSVNVVVSGLDADGNTVVGPFATPVTLSEADATGDTSLSSTTIASASNTVTLSYNGAYPFLSATITATMGTLSATATFAPVPAFLATYQEAPLGPPAFGTAGLNNIMLGPDGNLYAVGSQFSEFAKIATNGAITAYPLPSSSDVLMGLVAGSDGNLWTAEYQNNAIAKFNPGTGAITEYPLPTGTYGVALANAVALGKDGNVWFTDQLNDVVGSITPAGIVTEYPLPTNDNPQGITAGPDGNLWITDSGNNTVAKVSLTGSVLASYSVPTANSSPYGIAPGPDGNLWFTELNGSKIARITTGGTITEFVTPSGASTPLDIIAGPDGRMWFAEAGPEIGLGKIGYITTDGRSIRDFEGDGTHVYSLTFDRSDTLWYTTIVGSFAEIGTFAY